MLSVQTINLQALLRLILGYKRRDCKENPKALWGKMMEHTLRNDFRLAVLLTGWFVEFSETEKMKQEHDGIVTVLNQRSMQFLQLASHPPEAS